MVLDWFMANPPSWAVKEPVDPLQAIVRHCAGGWPSHLLKKSVSSSLQPQMGLEKPQNQRIWCPIWGESGHQRSKRVPEGTRLMMPNACSVSSYRTILRARSPPATSRAPAPNANSDAPPVEGSSLAAALTVAPAKAEGLGDAVPY